MADSRTHRCALPDLIYHRPLSDARIFRWDDATGAEAIAEILSKLADEATVASSQDRGVFTLSAAL